MIIGMWPRYIDIEKGKVLETKEIRKIVDWLKKDVQKESTNFNHLTGDIASGKSTIASLLGFEIDNENEDWLVYFMRKGAFTSLSKYNEVIDKLGALKTYCQKNYVKSMIICEDIHLSVYNFESLIRASSKFNPEIHFVFIARNIFWDLLGKLQTRNQLIRLKDRFSGTQRLLNIDELRDKRGITIAEDIWENTAEKLISYSHKAIKERYPKLSRKEIKKFVFSLKNNKLFLKNKQSNLYYVKFALMTIEEKGELNENLLYDRVIKHLLHNTEILFLLSRNQSREHLIKLEKDMILLFVLLSVFTKYEIALKIEFLISLEFTKDLITNLISMGLILSNIESVMLIHPAIAQLVLNAVNNYKLRDKGQYPEENSNIVNIEDDLRNLIIIQSKKIEKINSIIDIEQLCMILIFLHNEKKYGEIIQLIKRTDIDNFMVVIDFIGIHIFEHIMKDIQDTNQGIEQFRLFLTSLISPYGSLEIDQNIIKSLFQVILPFLNNNKRSLIQKINNVSNFEEKLSLLNMLLIISKNLTFNLINNISFENLTYIVGYYLASDIYFFIKRISEIDEPTAKKVMTKISDLYIKKISTLGFHSQIAWSLQTINKLDSKLAYKIVNSLKENWKQLVAKTESFYSFIQMFETIGEISSQILKEILVDTSADIEELYSKAMFEMDCWQFLSSMSKIFPNYILELLKRNLKHTIERYNKDDNYKHVVDLLNKIEEINESECHKLITEIDKEIGNTHYEIHTRDYYEYLDELYANDPASLEYHEEQDEKDKAFLQQILSNIENEVLEDIEEE